MKAKELQPGDTYTFGANPSVMDVRSVHPPQEGWLTVVHSDNGSSIYRPEDDVHLVSREPK